LDVLLMIGFWRIKRLANEPLDSMTYISN